MPYCDMEYEKLLSYTSSVEPPSNLEEFWTTTIAHARARARPPVITSVDTGLSLVSTYDVTFSGFAGDPVHAWYHRAAGVADSLPLVVRYQGYGAGRGLPHRVGPLVLAGYACLEVDTRGQGSAGSPGHTADAAGSGPAYPGFLTRGIERPEDYYYRRVFTDAVRAVDCALELPGVDSTRVAVAGESQGGGIALAAAGLHHDVSAAMVDVPFLSDFRRAVALAAGSPYSELAGYLSTHRDRVEQVFATLAYFDACVLAARASAIALFSVALMDQVCPPSTVYAAYNAYGGRKEIRCYPYNNHEGGQAFQEAAQLRWLPQAMPAAAPPSLAARL